MEEITLNKVVAQYDKLYSKLDSIDSLTYALILASSAGIDANELTGALYLLSDTTRYTRDEMEKINKQIYKTLSAKKEKQKENEQQGGKRNYV